MSCDVRKASIFMASELIKGTIYFLRFCAICSMIQYSMYKEITDFTYKLYIDCRGNGHRKRII